MSKKASEKIAVFFELEGEQAERFRKYKADEYLRSTAEAARKLMLERLNQVEKEQAEPAAA